VTYVAKEDMGPACEGCAFKDSLEPCNQSPCGPDARSDKRSVIWVAVGKESFTPPAGAPTVYVIGSLRNPEVPNVAAKLRAAGFDAFDDWYAAGPEADDYWQKYERARHHSYAEALAGYAAQHVFNFDKHHLDRCDAAVLVLPAGKSGHLELGYCAGKGKRTFILLEEQEPERFDVMYQFATKVVRNMEELEHELKR
jgi:hypothetical protein